MKTPPVTFAGGVQAIGPLAEHRLRHSQIGRTLPDMCNLYSITKGQAAIRAWFRVARDLTGNLPPMPGVFPDYAAPIIRMIDGERALTMARPYALDSLRKHHQGSPGD